MKKIHKIVLTGGPCAGKTAVLSALKDRFGDDLVIIPEVATQLLEIPYDQGGPGVPGRDLPWSQEWQDRFQKMVTEKQLADETYQVTATDVVADGRNRPMVIVCDRGILDGAAYVGDRDVFLKQFGLNLDDCFALYDKVIHLNSVAVDDPQKYEELKATNPSRFEDADEATKLDNALFAVYEGHPNHIRVGAGEGIETKIETVFQEIEAMLESTEHREVGSIESPEKT